MLSLSLIVILIDIVIGVICYVFNLFFNLSYLIGSIFAPVLGHRVHVQAISDHCSFPETDPNFDLIPELTFERFIYSVIHHLKPLFKATLQWCPHLTIPVLLYSLEVPLTI
jgi:hypothetical protein